METHPIREKMRRNAQRDAIVGEHVARITQQGHEAHLKAAQDNQRRIEREKADSHKISPFKYGDPV